MHSHCGLESTALWLDLSMCEEHIHSAGVCTWSSKYKPSRPLLDLPPDNFTTDKKNAEIFTISFLSNWMDINMNSLTKVCLVVATIQFSH